MPPDRTPRPSPTADLQAMAAVAAGLWNTPFDILGPHSVRLDGGEAIAVRPFIPEAAAGSRRAGRRSVPMERYHPEGFFEGLLPPPRRARAGAERPSATARYRLAVTGRSGRTALLDDPYRLPAVLTEESLRVF